MHSVKPTALCKLRVAHRSHRNSPKTYYARNEVADYQGSFEPGDLLHVEDAGGHLLGVGFVNPLSKIAVRLVSEDQDTVVDQSFLEERIARSHQFRMARTDCPDCYRVVSSDADQLPGLIVDRYGDYLGVQFLNPGMDRLRESTVAALVAQLKPTGIYEQGAEAIRAAETLPPSRATLYGQVPDTFHVSMNGIIHLVSTKHGEGTGLHLDQRDNYQVVMKYIKPRDEVLDTYCHTGGLALAAAKRDAIASGIDPASWAVDMASAAIIRNECERNCRFACAELPQALSRFAPNSFDAVALDLPLPSGKPSARNTLRLYERILAAALPLVKPDGILIASSRCDLVTPESYLDHLTSAGVSASRSLTFLEILGQPWDFPWLAGQAHQRYLTCIIARVS